MSKERPILLANDFHIAKDNIEEFRKNWEEMEKVAQEYDCEFVHIGGDLFDSPTVQTLPVILSVQDMLLEAKDDYKLTVNITPGNHDKPNREDEASWVDYLSLCASVYSKPFKQRLSDDGLYLFQFPYYLEGAEFQKALDWANESLKKDGIDKRQVILYLHEGIHGALGDFEVPNELPQGMFDDYYKVLCGHYHNRTHIKGTNIYYIGASRAHNFGEDEEKGYTLLWPNGDTEFIKNEVNTRYVTEHLKVSELKDWQSKYDKRYKVRLIVSCNSDDVETIDKQLLIDKGASKIEFNTEKIQAIKVEQSDMNEKFDTKNLQQEYKEFCGEKDLDDKMGMKYLRNL